MGRCKLWGPWIPSFYMPLSYLGPNPVFFDFSHPPSSSAITVGVGSICWIAGIVLPFGSLHSWRLEIADDCLLFSHQVFSNSSQDPMDCSTPGFPLPSPSHHAQVRDSWVGDGIQPSHPLPRPSLPALNLSSIRVFSNESAVHIRWQKYWSFSIRPSNEYSGLISFKIDGLISLLLHPCLLMWPEIFHFTKVI